MQNKIKKLKGKYTLKESLDYFNIKTVVDRFLKIKMEK